MTEQETETIQEKIGVFIDCGVCTKCAFFMVEEVDYTYYQTEDGGCLAIPEGHMPPAFICARDGTGGKLYPAVGISYHDSIDDDVEPTECEYFEEAEDD